MKVTKLHTEVTKLHAKVNGLYGPSHTRPTHWDINLGEAKVCDTANLWAGRWKRINSLSEDGESFMLEDLRDFRLDEIDEIKFSREGLRAFVQAHTNRPWPLVIHLRDSDEDGVGAKSLTLQATHAETFLDRVGFYGEKGHEEIKLVDDWKHNGWKYDGEVYDFITVYPRSMDDTTMHPKT
tara:strand:+ start:210 stop:752 length:543 start_codon:yes stop_codon:yes gene_type:complete